MVKTNELVVNALVEGGITHAFTLPGLGITWSLPAFKAQEKKINVVLARSEWIASVMAQTAGRLLRRPSVLMGQGPWITTIGGMGILEAHFSGSPMVVLTETSDYDGYGQMGVYQTMTGDYAGADAMVAAAAAYDGPGAGDHRLCPADLGAQCADQHERRHPDSGRRRLDQRRTLARHRPDGDGRGG